MNIACCVPNATNTHSEYVILIAFPLQQSLHERYTYIACLVCTVKKRDITVKPLVHFMFCVTGADRCRFQVANS
jgi:hypothetical protein